VIYKTPSPQGGDGGPAEPGPGKPADDVIDAEVVDGDRNKN
jgi:hypothetical protein